MSDRETSAEHGRARRIGAVVQGLVLGVLLAVALVQLAVMSTGAAIFRYQGF
ncbi:MAG: hypothetical protein KDK06_20845 [Gammaproteobacteria bacterium]|nr:hypothetical protein [Gammaproteobacteria bacterium]